MAPSKSAPRRERGQEQYRYRDALFPSVRFRQAYDQLRERHAAAVASKQYLKILEMAARDSESGTDEALRDLLARGQVISAEAVERLLKLGFRPVPVTEVEIVPVDLGQYDGLLAEREVAV